VKLLAYNFAAKPRTVGLRFWRLAPGDYTWRLGVDSDGDDEIERALKSGKLRVKERGERLRLSLPARQVLVLEVRQSSVRGSASGLPDIAVAADEVTVRRSVLSPDEADIVVPIHNLGPAPAENVTVNIKVEQGAVSQLITRKLSLPACSDLEPAYRTIHAGFSLLPGSIRLTVSASFNGNEITRRNNACRVPVTIPVRTASHP
ncbi:MAG: hypothetical protein NTU88_12205, partial [Armatimonadetes bacterium]|nr:hypothetical protein [Armatimonadota bacterium]